MVWQGFYTRVGQSVASFERGWKALLRFSMAGLLASALAGCSAISIPLGDVFGQQNHPGATVTAVPVTAVTKQTLAPLPRPSASIEADPITTGTISAPTTAIPYGPIKAITSPSTGSTLAHSGLAAVPADLTPGTLLTPEDMALVSGTLANAFLDQDHAATLPWLNEVNGHGGLIVPVGAPLRQPSGICRVVVISVQPRGQAVQWLQANACRQEGASWALSDQRAWRNPA